MPAHFDLALARQETPGCEITLHFDNAGASLMPRPVLDAVVGHLELEARVGGYEAALRADETVEKVYDRVAALIGCERDEVAIIENATRAWDAAFYSIPFRPGDRILTAKAAYASNFIAFLQVAQRTGVCIDVIPNDEQGQLSVDALREMIDDRVKLIAVTHVPTNGGLVNPAAEVGAVAQETDALYLLDACQSVGQMPVDVSEIRCDMLSATGRKFLRGPRGTGFLFVRKGVLDLLEPPFLDLHAATWVSREDYEIRGDARRFETWEANVAGKIGLGVAIDYAMRWGVALTWGRIQELAELLRQRLTEEPGISVHDLGAKQCGIVSFAIDGSSAADIHEKLRLRGINVSSSTVLSTRLDMEERGLIDLVRASVHYYNSEAEVDRFLAALRENGVG
jgi:selenocysteine lyase/cysteine desulfurase